MNEDIDFGRAVAFITLVAAVSVIAAVTFAAFSSRIDPCDKSDRVMFCSDPIESKKWSF